MTKVVILRYRDDQHPAFRIDDLEVEGIVSEVQSIPDPADLNTIRMMVTATFAVDAIEIESLDMRELVHRALGMRD